MTARTSSASGTGSEPARRRPSCVEEGKAQAAKLEYEYSPGNGGNAANPVYWRVKQESAKPAGCETVTVTLTHP